MTLCYHNYSRITSLIFYWLGYSHQHKNIDNQKYAKIDEAAPPKDLEEQLGICTDEEREMLEQNTWKSKTDLEKDSEIFLKDLVKKKVYNHLYTKPKLKRISFSKVLILQDFYFFLGTTHQVSFCVIARKSRFDGSNQSRKINTPTMHAWRSD